MINDPKFVIFSIGIILMLFFQYYSQSLEYEIGIFYHFIFTLFTLSISIVLLFYITKVYEGQVFRKSFFVLGLGYISYLVAEVIYYVFDILDYQTFPSIADPFWLGIYVGSLYFIIFYLRYFGFKFNLSTIAFLTIIPSIMIMSYIYVSMISDVSPFYDYYYGIIFVSLTSLVFSFSVFGVKIFLKGIMGKIWILFTIGFMINSIGDAWWMYLEAYELYTLIHPVNITWRIADCFIIFALIRHFREF